MEKMVGEIVKAEAVEMMVEVVVIIKVVKDMFEVVEEVWTSCGGDGDGHEDSKGGGVVEEMVRRE